MKGTEGELSRLGTAGTVLGTIFLIIFRPIYMTRTA